MIWKPTRSLHRLDVQPLLASSDAPSHPSQAALSRYLDTVDQAVQTAVRHQEDKRLYLRVHAAVENRAALLAGHDLEDYLSPLAQRLRTLPIVFAHATKGVDSKGFIEVGLAEAAEAPGTGWAAFTGGATGSAGSKKWKARLRQRVIASGATKAPAGPLEMVVAMRCSPRRAWLNLWKPVAGSLGPILGEPTSDRYDPADDRIVGLALHLEEDTEIGWDVRVKGWWRAST